MSPRSLLRLLAAYAVVLVIVALGVRARAGLDELPSERRTVVESRWKHGKLVGRTTRAGDAGAAGSPFEVRDGETVVEEIAVAEGPLSLAPLRFELWLVPGKDGIRGELGGKTAWVTVDDLLAAQAYDHATSFLDPSLGMGTHRATAVHLLAGQLGVTPKEVVERASVRRVRFERRIPGAAPATRVSAASLDRASVKARVRDAALFLARGVDEQGRYRYLLDATTNRIVPGYNWPRHAGTTFFLAQAAALTEEPVVRYACLSAASRLRSEMTSCGANRCIAEGGEASVGANALALIAFSEIVKANLDPAYRRPAAELAAFLRSQQRPDGELMHFYDLRAQRPLDEQVMYFTGEASLALSRAHRITSDPEDLRAASRALAHLSSKGWTFFGSRYYFTEEHWTCQAMADLWDRARDEAALGFCLRWHEYQRALQKAEGETPFDADGSFGFGPLVTPRVTPASSRGEAAVAALDVVKRELAAGSRAAPGADARTAELLSDELRRAVAFVARSQLSPGPTHLFPNPEAVRGGFPGSAVDLQLRIDYAQHAGSMMVRWLEVDAPPPPTPPTLKK